MPTSPTRRLLIALAAATLLGSTARAAEPIESEDTAPSPAAGESPGTAPSMPPALRPPGKYNIAPIRVAARGRNADKVNALLRSVNKRIADINARLDKGQWYNDMRQTVQAVLDDLMVAHTVYRYKPAGEKARNVILLFKAEMIADENVRYKTSLASIEFRVDPKPKNIESWNFSYLPVGVTNTNPSTLTKNFLANVKFYIVTTKGFQDRALQSNEFTQEDLAKWINSRGGPPKFTLDEDLMGRTSKLVHLIFPRRLDRDEIAKIIVVLDNPRARSEVDVPFWENIKDSDWPKFLETK